MSRFVNIDPIMAPVQISHNSTQDSMPRDRDRDNSRGEHVRSASQHSPSWTGVRSLLGSGRTQKEGSGGGGEGSLASQLQENSSSSPNSISSDPSSVSSLIPSAVSSADKVATDKSKAAKRQKSKEPKSYKSTI
jgi:hypothetical protein